jgi:hypothetical protein
MCGRRPARIAQRRHAFRRNRALDAAEACARTVGGRVTIQAVRDKVAVKGVMHACSHTSCLEPRHRLLARRQCGSIYVYLLARMAEPGD